MARTSGPSPRLQRLAAFGATALLAAATAVAFGRVFEGGGAVFKVVLAGLASAAVASALERRNLLLATVVSAVVMVAVVGLLVLPETTWHGLPTMDTLRAMGDSAALVGSPATRHLGTLGGNLCNASPAMETGSPLLVFDASVELRSVAGSRMVPVAGFLTGPGRSALAPGELLVAVVIPPRPAGRVGSAYLRLEYRAAMEIAVVGAAALVTLDAEGRCVEARIAITAVAPTVVRVEAAERVLSGHAPTAEVIAAAAAAAGDAARPIDDVRASARYRVAMVPVLVRRALEAALVRAGEGVA